LNFEPSLNGIRAEKARLHRKLQKQEKRLERDWERIEDSWRFFNNITKIGNRLLSSVSLISGLDLGYKILSHYFPKKNKSTT